MAHFLEVWWKSEEGDNVFGRLKIHILVVAACSCRSPSCGRELSLDGEPRHHRFGCRAKRMSNSDKSHEARVGAVQGHYRRSWIPLSNRDIGLKLRLRTISATWAGMQAR
jgi:hypothetical protein